MIQIKHPELTKIENSFSTKIVLAIESRIVLIEEVIQLLNSKSQVSPIKKEYSKALMAILNDKSIKCKSLETLKKTILKKRKNNNSNRFNDITIVIQYLRSSENIKKIISSQPDALLNFQVVFFSINSFLQKKDLLIQYLFNYDDFYKNYISQIAEDLNLKVCPYCNRNYITHVQGKGKKRIIGPTFDHFFHKSQNPLLAVSFYNLIPSCSLCNSNLKGQIPFDLKTHLHPYIHSMGDDAKFSFNFNVRMKGEIDVINYTPILKTKVNDTSEEFLRLEGKPDDDVTGSIKVFKLREIYATHSDTVEEIHLKFDKNSPHYIKSIKDKLSLLGASEEEFYRFHFSNYYKQDDFHRRPLAKLTKDIYEEMKKIVPF